MLNKGIYMSDSHLSNADVSYPAKELTIETVGKWLFTATDIHTSIKFKGLSLPLATISRLRKEYPELVGPSSDTRYSYSYATNKQGVKIRTPVYYFTFVDACMLSWMQSLKTTSLRVRDAALITSGKEVRRGLEKFVEFPDFHCPDIKVVWCPLACSGVTTHVEDLAYVIMRAVSKKNNIGG